MIGRIAIVLLLFFCVQTSAQDSTIVYPAKRGLPTVEGHGQNATGGAGQAIYQVTNLNNSGAGSFRDAVSQGNRYIVFRVGGIINISGSRLYFGGSNITIAGETAPGNGVAIYGSMVDSNNYENIIIRHVNFMAGNPGVTGDDSFRLRNTGTGAKENFIFDHCGFYWGKDETFAIEANSQETGSIEKMTMNRCIIGESFNSKGFIIWRQGFDISVLNTLFTNNRERNIRSSTRYASWEQINNVIYNTVNAVNATYSNEFDIIGNVFFRGNGRPTGEVRLAQAPSGNEPLGVLNDSKVFIDNNTYEGSAISHNVSGTPLKDTRQVSSGYVPILNTGNVVRDNVLSDVGPNYNGNTNLALSQINDVLNDTGSFITSESGSTGISLTGGTPFTDSDADGMEDAWETLNGLNPVNSADRNNRPATVVFDYGAYNVTINQSTNNASYASTGWTAIELYHHYLAGDHNRMEKIADTGAPPVITLNGPSTVYYTVGDTYEELGATMIDGTYGDISGDIVITGTPNMSIAGTYYVYYNGENVDEVAATQRTREVVVNEEGPEPEPSPPTRGKWVNKNIFFTLD